MPSLREQRSLFGEILDWMLAPLLLLWPMSVALTWLVAQSIANRPYDRELADSLRALSKQVAVASAQSDAPDTAPRSLLEYAATQLLRPDDHDEIFFQVLGKKGELTQHLKQLGQLDPDARRAYDEQLAHEAALADAELKAVLDAQATRLPRFAQDVPAALRVVANQLAA